MALVRIMLAIIGVTAVTVAARESSGQVRIQAAITTQSESASMGRPEKLTVTIGDVLIRIDGPKMWTLSGFDYQIGRAHV